MKVRHKIQINIFKTTAMLLLGAVAFQGFSQYELAAVCEAKADQEKEEVEKFIREYYRAYSEGDRASLRDYISDEEELDKEMLRIKVLREYGFVRQNVTDAIVYDLSDDRYWLAFVSSEMIIEDLDVVLPGAKGILAGKDKEGNLYMVMNDESDALGKDLLQEMREIMLSDEIVDWSNEVAAEYNEILADNSEALQWITQVSDAQTKALSEAYTKKEYQEKRGREEEAYYLVQKGDCLWSIAEQELGDGMYWSEIYKANKTAIGDNPDLLYVGVKLDLQKITE